LIWFDKYREDGTNDCEVDLLAVVDGETIAVEATTSKTLKTSEIQKLAAFAERVRPDKLYVVCGANGQRAREQLATKIQESLPEAVKVEVVTYEVTGERNDPYLPR
jgi:Holliday junction resolvase